MSPSSTVMARPPSFEHGAQRRRVGVEGEHARPARRLPSRIAKVRGSSPLSTTQPLGRVMRVMTALTSASWSTVSTPCSPRWSALHVGDHRDVVVRDAQPAQQDAAAGGLGDGELDPRVVEHPAGPAGPGVVTRLDELAVDVDTVGRRPADDQPGALRHPGDHPRRRGLAVGAGDRHDRDLRRAGVRRLAGLAATHGRAGRSREPRRSTVRRGQRVEHVGHGVTERLGPAPVPPREGHDERGAGRPSAGCARRAGSCPTRRATRRTTEVTTRSANRCRSPVPVAPAAGRQAQRSRRARRASSSGSPSSAETSRVSFTAGRGK